MTDSSGVSSFLDRSSDYDYPSMQHESMYDYSIPVSTKNTVGLTAPVLPPKPAKTSAEDQEYKISNSSQDNRHMFPLPQQPEQCQIYNDAQYEDIMPENETTSMEATCEVHRSDNGKYVDINFLQDVKELLNELDNSASTDNHSQKTLKTKNYLHTLLKNEKFKPRIEIDDNTYTNYTGEVDMAFLQDTADLFEQQDRSAATDKLQDTTDLFEQQDRSAATDKLQDTTDLFEQQDRSAATDKHPPIILQQSESPEIKVAEKKPNRNRLFNCMCCFGSPCAETIVALKEGKHSESARHLAAQKKYKKQPGSICSSIIHVDETKESKAVLSAMFTCREKVNNPLIWSYKAQENRLKADSVKLKSREQRLIDIREAALLPIREGEKLSVIGCYMGPRILVRNVLGEYGLVKLSELDGWTKHPYFNKQFTEISSKL